MAARIANKCSTSPSHACRLSLDFATTKKRRKIDRLLEAYRGAVNVSV